ncbi:hypothetical protein V6N13_054926 [Hibiscus sabdariffa]|uniref:Uncharacterized protein n=1 Tax=Hibiscus sabdariffa TaxID=183260 RepID=A0ABR2DXJ2_9ROSI
MSVSSFIGKTGDGGWNQGLRIHPALLNVNLFIQARHIGLSSGVLFKFRQLEIDDFTRECNPPTSSGIDSRSVQVGNPLSRLVNPVHPSSSNLITGNGNRNENRIMTVYHV